MPGAPSTIMGYPYTLNPEWNDGATNNAIYAAFGDLSSYIVRIAADVDIAFADQLHLASNQLGWYGFARFGGRPVKPGGTAAALNPIKVMTAVA